MIALFGTDAKYNVVGLGDPSYTSRIHAWNGTAANLNNNVILILHIPIDTIGCDAKNPIPSVFLSVTNNNRDNSPKFIVPVAPYTIPEPNT